MTDGRKGSAEERLDILETWMTGMMDVKLNDEPIKVFMTKVISELREYQNKVENLENEIFKLRANLSSFRANQERSGLQMKLEDVQLNVAPADLKARILGEW